MAFFRLEFTVHARTGGGDALRSAAYGSGSVVRATQSAVARAAYRSGSALEDERTGKVHDYRGKTHEVEFSRIMAPANAPDWVYDRQELWSQVERREDRSNRSESAQLFRECLLTLPRELGREERIKLVTAFVQEHFVSRGMIADVNIHNPSAADGGEQPHAHVMLTMRKVCADGFGNKDRSWNEKSFLRETRQQWEAYENDHLAKHGSHERVSCERLKKQGIEREAQKPRGVSPKHAKEPRQRGRVLRYEDAALKRRALENVLRGTLLPALSPHHGTFIGNAMLSVGVHMLEQGVEMMTGGLVQPDLMRRHKPEHEQEQGQDID